MSAKQMCFKGFFGRAVPFNDVVVDLVPKSIDIGRGPLQRKGQRLMDEQGEYLLGKVLGHSYESPYNATNIIEECNTLERSLSGLSEENIALYTM